MAADSINLNYSHIVYAGGQDNMTLAPHLLLNSRQGYRFGSTELKDHLQYDGLWDPYDNVPMGVCGELCAKEYSFSRQEQDEYAKQSYLRAQQAISSGHFKNEIVPINVKTRKSELTVEQDEEPFGINLEKISSLKPAFKKDGSITAANASSINDGAALVVVSSEQKAQELDIKPLAKIIASNTFAQEPKWFTTSPIHSIKKLLQDTHLTTKDIGIFEINEAFSVVTMVAIKELNLDPSKVNPFGGAVSLGHPIGASGARILTTLIHGLKAKGERYGIASICIGGGEACSMLIELC
jgi:acetyl-CoA C-acetyltransferase